MTNILKKNEKIEEEKNSYIKNKIDLMNDSEKIATELKNLGSFSKKLGKKNCSHTNRDKRC